MKLPKTSLDEQYLVTDGTNDISGPEWDYSELRNADASRRFQASTDYCFSYSDDSDDGGYDPSRECFVVNFSGAPAPELAHTPNGALHSAHSSMADSVAEAPVPPNPGAQRAWLDELEEAQCQLDDERARLHQQLGQDPNPTPARVWAKDVRQRIINNDRDVVDGTPVFKRASQNLAVAVILLRKVAEPTTPQEKEMHKQIKTLFETATMQQAESSTSRQRGSKSRGHSEQRRPAASS
jgi:hypothetical protein